MWFTYCTLVALICATFKDPLLILVDFGKLPAQLHANAPVEQFLDAQEDAAQALDLT